MQDPRRKLPPTVLRALAAALVPVAAVIIALANVGMGAAEEGDEQEEASEVLQPTEIVADIPEGYGELFPLDWGGGSLYHLKGRLATMSCMANTLWLHDGGEWRGYNQYNVPSTLTQEFRDQYAEFVPPGRLHATCFRICEFSYAEHEPKPCETLDSLRQRSCTRDFAPVVTEAVRPMLPLLPETCIVRTTGIGLAGYAPTPFVLYGPSPRYLLPTKVPYIEVNSFFTASQLSTELHELCHINQHWYTAQRLRTDVVMVAGPLRIFETLWVNTEAGTKFIQLTGFMGADGNWALPDDSVYRDPEWTYGEFYPTELSAELCSLLIYERLDLETDRPFADAEFDYDRYLTPEIRHWLETWMLLPELTGQSDD